MPKGPNGQKRPADVIGAAVLVGRISPAMAAGITDELLDMTHLCKLMDDANPPKKRGPYKKASDAG
jgi:hypothetical protein